MIAEIERRSKGGIAEVGAVVIQGVVVAARSNAGCHVAGGAGPFNGIQQFRRCGLMLRKADELASPHVIGQHNPLPFCFSSANG